MKRIERLLQFLRRFLDAFRVGKRCTCGLAKDELAEATGDRGFVGLYSFNVSMRVTRRITLVPFSLRLLTPHAGIHDGRKFRSVVGTSVRINFLN